MFFLAMLNVYFSLSFCFKNKVGFILSSIDLISHYQKEPYGWRLNWGLLWFQWNTPKRNVHCYAAFDLIPVNLLITNIEPKVDDAYNLSIPKETVDRVVAITCLPEIPNPIQVLCECKRILKPDGIISLCELIFDPDYPRRKTEIKWAKEAGLELDEEFSNVLSYQLNFEKMV